MSFLRSVNTTFEIEYLGVTGEVTIKTVTHGVYSRYLDLLVRSETSGTRNRRKVETVTQNKVATVYLVANSLVSWRGEGFTDEATNRPLEISEKTIANLPAKIVDTIFNQIIDFNGLGEEEALAEQAGVTVEDIDEKKEASITSLSPDDPSL